MFDFVIIWSELNICCLNCVEQQTGLLVFIPNASIKVESSIFGVNFSQLSCWSASPKAAMSVWAASRINVLLFSFIM